MKHSENLYKEAQDRHMFVKGMYDKATEEKRSLSDEEINKVDTLLNEAGDFEKRAMQAHDNEMGIERLSRSAGTQIEETSQIETRGRVDDSGENEFRNWLRSRKISTGEKLDEFELRGLINRQTWLRGKRAGIVPGRYEELDPNASAEYRALTVGTDATGGYLVQEEEMTRYEKLLRDMSTIRSLNVTVVPTSSGATLPWPSVDDTANQGDTPAEGVATATNQDPTFGNVNIDVVKYSSGGIIVNREAFEDWSFPVGDIVIDLLAERITDHSEGDFIATLIASKASGRTTKVAAAAFTGAAVATTLIDLEHSLAAQYRRRAEFLISDWALREAKKVSFATNYGVWSPQPMREGAPGNILGYNYSASSRLNGAGTAGAPNNNQTYAVFGDYSKFVIREVGSVRMAVDTSLKVLEDQVVYVARHRMGSAVVSPTVFRFLDGSN